MTFSRPASPTCSPRLVTATLSQAPGAQAAAARRGPGALRIAPRIDTERLSVPRNQPKLRLVGEDAATTVLTYSLNAPSPGPNGRPVGASGSTSTEVLADDFTAEN